MPRPPVRRRPHRLWTATGPLPWRSSAPGSPACRRPLHLAEQGVDVVVLEAYEPGWGASGRNGGQVNPGLKHDPDKVEADLGAEMVRFSGEAPNVVFVTLIQRHQIACEALQSGTLRNAFGRREPRPRLNKTAGEQWARRTDAGQFTTRIAM